MTKFEPGDIIEIALTSSQKYPEWAGLTIVVTSHQSDAVCGEVIKAAKPDRGFPVGKKLDWGVPSAFTHVQTKIKEQQKDKYLSPFSGRWE